MTKIFFFLICLGGVQCLNMQKVSNYTLLQTALTIDAFDKEFSLCANKSDTLLLYDKALFLSSDTSFRVCNKIIEVIHQAPKDITSPNVIILHRFVTKFSKYSLYFWKPYSGAIVNFKFKYRINKKITLVDMEIGSI